MEESILPADATRSGASMNMLEKPLAVGFRLDDLLEEIECVYIKKALEMTKGKTGLTMMFALRGFLLQRRPLLPQPTVMQRQRLFERRRERYDPILVTLALVDAHLATVEINVTKADSEPDQAKREQMYNDAQKILTKDAPVGFVYTNAAWTLVKPWVQGWKLAALDYYFSSLSLYNMSITTAKPK